MKPLNDDGAELAALYSIEHRSDGFDLIVESRGGAKDTGRNSDYAAAMELHLTRMAMHGLVLQDLQVASTVAMKKPENDRRVELDGFPLPLTLTRSLDIRELRHSIGRASAAYGRSDGSDRGNRTKRMLLRMLWAPTGTLDASVIDELLAGQTGEVEPPEAPTSDPDELMERVRRASARMKRKSVSGAGAPPRGNKTVTRKSGSSSQFVRDPNVIAWVLYVAAGKCEVCGCTAPFQRDDGEPYLEVHHVRPLGEGGPDTTDNAVACCPNCHRCLHHAAERDSIRTRVIGAIGRLVDYPFQ